MSGIKSGESLTTLASSFVMSGFTVPLLTFLDGHKKLPICLLRFRISAITPIMTHSDTY